jgi:predicted nucleic acid-binding protein
MYKPTHFIYWDSCVFISWLEKDPNRYDTIYKLFHQTVEQQGKIVTSVISVAEVAYVAQEKQQGILAVETENQLDALWNNPAIQLVEAPKHLMQETRRLMRLALSHRWSLKPADALHLATAEWVNKKSPTPVNEFHTYDARLEKYKIMIGLEICEPHVAGYQSSMFD